MAFTHKPSRNGQWRVLVLRHNWWERKWIWSQCSRLASITLFPPYFAMLEYVSMRSLVRKGMDDGVRLIAPDGTIAAEEYATFRSVEAAKGDRLERHRIKWPKDWVVIGRKRHYTAKG